jgi:transposase, IS30 family
MPYTHLTEHERYQIFSLQKAGLSNPAIARALGRHRSTINRELKRNVVFDPVIKGYSPSRANALARHRIIARSHRKRISALTWQEVVDQLKQRHSPEQISGHRARCKMSAISHETIYKRIWADKHAGGELWGWLRGRLRRGRRYRRNRQRGQIAGRVGIELRSKLAERRARRGDYEIDLVFGKGAKAALLTIVDRRTRRVLVERVRSKHAQHVARALVRALKGSGRRVYSITSDNGKEFAFHRPRISPLRPVRSGVALTS